MRDTYSTIPPSKLLGYSIYQVVDILDKFRIEGRKVRAEFNGVWLYSDTVTLDDAYKKITGMTYDEFMEKYGRHEI